VHKVSKNPEAIS